MTDSNRPSVHVLGTGGTMMNVTGSYREPADFADAEAYRDALPDEVDGIADVEFREVTRVKSGSITVETWVDLAETIESRAASADGFVLAHGSNTAEETAYFLNLVAGTDRPVVVTAAQRHLGSLGSDAPRNLRDAVAVAAEPRAGGRGVLVVGNQEIHHARNATKLVADRPDLFRSPGVGPVGAVREEIEFFGTVRYASAGETPFGLEAVAAEGLALADVPIVSAAVGADGSQVEAAVDAGAAGIVVAGFPTGTGASPRGGRSQHQALLDAADGGIPVVMCHRGLEGFKPVAEPLVSGRDLRPQKARILLAVALAHGAGDAELREYFARC